MKNYKCGLCCSQRALFNGYEQLHMVAKHGLYWCCRDEKAGDKPAESKQKDAKVEGDKQSSSDVHA